MTMHQQPENVEYLTIIAPTAAEAMAQFATQRLGEQGYSIAGQIGRHRVAVLAEGQSVDLIRGDDMVAATFRRSGTSI